MLNTILHPGPPGPPLIIAHGLFGSARNWGVIAKRLSDIRTVVAVDMRNHGDSPWSDVHDYPAMAQDLAKVIADLGGRADVLGHSMGGKAAMVLALTAPAAVRNLIVADIAPRAYAHSQSDKIAAMRRVDLSAIASRAEAASQLGLTDPALAAFFLQSLDLAGRRWKLNLEALDANMPAIMGFPDLASRFDGPVLMLTGALSDYVGAGDLAAARALFPQAAQVTLPGCGHWLHAEDPRGFDAAVRGWLDRAD